MSKSRNIKMNYDLKSRPKPKPIIGAGAAPAPDDEDSAENSEKRFNKQLKAINDSITSQSSNESNKEFVKEVVKTVEPEPVKKTVKSKKDPPADLDLYELVPPDQYDKIVINTPIIYKKKDGDYITNALFQAILELNGLKKIHCKSSKYIRPMRYSARGADNGWEARLETIESIYKKKVFTAPATNNNDLSEIVNQLRKELDETKAELVKLQGQFTIVKDAVIKHNIALKTLSNKSGSV